MKKIALLLFLWYSLSFSAAFAQDETEPQANHWNMVSIGVTRTWGAEKYFEPISFSYFRQNSGFTDAIYFTLPPGASDNIYPKMYDIDPLGLGIQLTWPVGKKYNEVRAGFAFQKHYNSVEASSAYFTGADNFRLHSIALRNDYTMADATIDLVLETQPFFRTVQFFWNGGVILGTASDQDLIHTEVTIDIPKATLLYRPDGSFTYDASQGHKNISTTSLSSPAHIETGLRSSAGLEIQLEFRKQTIGFSGEMGLGLIGEQVLKGGSGNLKRTEFGLLRIRYFL